MLRTVCACNTSGWEQHGYISLHRLVWSCWPLMRSAALATMINLAIQPSDASATCLCVSSLLASLPTTLRSELSIQACATPTTTALLWLPSARLGDTSSELRRILLECRSIRFVQLPMTGVDEFVPLIRELRARRIVWCCSKGCFGEMCAEHALALTLSLLRRISCRSTTPEHVDSLVSKRVVIVGSGSIAQHLCTMLVPFRCTITCLDSNTSRSDLVSSLRDAQIIMIACALTQATSNLFNCSLFSLLSPCAILINVARAEIVHTPDLISALSTNKLHAAAADVFTPPPAHQLDQMQMLITNAKLLVTQHSAVPTKLIGSLLAHRIRANLETLVESLQADQQDQPSQSHWLGKVDPEKGY